MSSIFLASAFAGSAAPPIGHQGHGGAYGGPVSPDQMHGTYEFEDIRGKPITAADFKGHWSLLFFGYSRCKSSCPVATPKIVKAARMLRQRGVNARAAFVDIEAPPLGLKLRKSGEQVSEQSVHDHGDMNRVAAMRALAHSYGDDLMVLTGTRGQLANASRSFLVAREHIPARKGEEGHSIKHSARIYFIAPDTRIAGYGLHDDDPKDFVSAIVGLNRAYAG